MQEAVIVAAARSPIGRAGKGSLVSVRPDDLAASMVDAALAQIPELDRADIDDLYLGCGRPGGEQGYNMGRVVAVALGLDRVPAATITRYCASSVQTTRMAFHAVRAGEGDVFVSAGVECVSRLQATGCSDSIPGTRNPGFDDARARTGQRAEGGAEGWEDPGRPASCPTSTSRWGRPPRTSRNSTASPAATRTSSPSAARTSPNRRPPTGSGSARSPR
ncbi:hypothetical protein GCM10010182_12120 [Actinomadura cremea]|nr:hypothetical protein GCM10010182_12120 [Actinomadura cremea]